MVTASTKFRLARMLAYTDGFHAHYGILILAISNDTIVPRLGNSLKHLALSQFDFDITQGHSCSLILPLVGSLFRANTGRTISK